MVAQWEVRCFGPDTREAFYRLHGSFALPDHPGEEAGWCFCAAWWVPTWDAWGERTAAQNRQVREGLCARGEYDGYLLFVDQEPAAWCQVGRRDRLAKLVESLGLDKDPEVWAITCFMVAPRYRRQGLASCLLKEVLSDLVSRGVKRVEAYPKRGEPTGEGELWTGPEAMYRAAGFELAREHERFPVLSKKIG